LVKNNRFEVTISMLTAIYSDTDT